MYVRLRWIDRWDLCSFFRSKRILFYDGPFNGYGPRIIRTSRGGVRFVSGCLNGLSRVGSALTLPWQIARKKEARARRDGNLLNVAPTQPSSFIRETFPAVSPTGKLPSSNSVYRCIAGFVANRQRSYLLTALLHLLHFIVAVHCDRSTCLTFWRTHWSKADREPFRFTLRQTIKTWMELDECWNYLQEIIYWMPITWFFFSLCVN